MGVAAGIKFLSTIVTELSKKIGIQGRHVRIQDGGRFYGNAQGLASGINRIWTQHTQIDLKPSKTKLYMKVQGSVLCSLDYT